MSKVSKGRQREKQWMDILEKYYDMECWKPIRPRVKWIKNKDVFNLFDVIAVPKTKGNVELWQVKSNIGDFYKARKDVKKWMEKRRNVQLLAGVVVKTDRMQWRRWHICNGLDIDIEYKYSKEGPQLVRRY